MQLPTRRAKSASRRPHLPSIRPRGGNAQAPHRCDTVGDGVMDDKHTNKSAPTVRCPGCATPMHSSQNITIWRVD